jgi:formate hydrogenlyase subunit 4
MRHALLELALLAALPVWLTGVINRVKSLWAGRKGPPLFQLAFDVQRLLRKRPVYSATATPLFRTAPYVFLISACAAAAVVPLAGTSPLVAFRFDFVWLAYLWGLGRVAMMLGALDTGSAFEGMGAAREATFSTLVEPVLFLVAAALAWQAHASSLHLAFTFAARDLVAALSRLAAVGALFVVLQVETARLPVDDPCTHLELTMVHEVMVLDHSGPDLAAIQVGAAVKLATGAVLIATLLNPWAGGDPVAAALGNFAAATGVAIAVGTVESLIARFKLRAVPLYIACGGALALLALILTACRAGGR